MKRNLFWGLLGLMLTLLGFSNSTGPPTTTASHESFSMRSTDDGINASASTFTKEGAATGVFNGASPLDTIENVAVLMVNEDQVSGYHDTGQEHIRSDDVAEPLIAFTVSRNDRSVVRLN